MSSSYDLLLKQVESLKAENCHLKKELEDNSSHLTTLENEASTMKDVLTHIHSSMAREEDNFKADSIHVMDNVDIRDQNSNSSNDENSSDQNWTQTQAGTPFCVKEVASGIQLPCERQLQPEQSSLEGEGRTEEVAGGVSLQQSAPDSPDPSGSPTKKRTLDKEFYSRFQELDQERNQIMEEMDREEEHRKWYYEQLEILRMKLENIPVTEQYDMQADMTRRQLEYEMQHLQELMEESVGSSEQVSQRHESRLQRISNIEANMIQMQKKHRAKVEKEKRDSGTCDHLEIERDEGGVVVTDATTNTLVSGEAYGPCSTNEIENAESEPGVSVSGPNGSKLVTIATQTPEERLAEQAEYDSSALHLSNQSLASLYHGAWPLTHGNESHGSIAALANQETASVMSFNSSNASSTPSQHQRLVHQQLGTKVEMVYSLLSMLGTHDKDDMSRTLLAMSSSQDSCIAMRQSGCLPLLIQLLHGSDKDSGLLGNTRGSKAARARAAAALHNIVHSHPDDKRGRREARVLRLLEQIRAHCDQLRGSTEEEEEENQSRTGSGSADIDHHPGPAIAALMKLSFDEEHRHAICTLGGLQAIAELLQLDHDVNGNTNEQYNITMRRYACMALTNLTFGDGTNKALLCSMKLAMKALVAQLHSTNEDLRQVAASVLRNLSWRADLASKKTLREVGSVTGLMLAAMEVKKESTLKSILSALWNLSAHCSENKADICLVNGSLAFLVSSLTYKSPSKTLAIIENGGGILRNISSHIAVREDYRKDLRHHSCLQILLKHLRSPSLTVVSNACGTLWNLSARCSEDQKALWDMGAVNMLRNLVHSKHKMISMGSAAALKNLLSAKPTLNNSDDGHFSKTNVPGLHVRKARALEAELDQDLSETCENLEAESPHSSPTEARRRLKYVFSGDNGGVYHVPNMDQQRRPLIRGQLFPRGCTGDQSPHNDKVMSPPRSVSRSGSQDSISSSHSDVSLERSTRVPNVLLKSTKLLQDRQNMSFERGRSYRESASVNNDPQKTAESASERGRIGSGANSRIMKVMQEVVLHASMDDGRPPYYSLQAACNPVDKLHTNHHHVQATAYCDKGQAIYPRRPGANNSVQDYSNSSDIEEANNSISQHNNDMALNINLSGLSHCMENLHLNMPEADHEQDEPINYSMKYRESQSKRGRAPTVQQRPNNQVTPSQTSAFVKPIPKVQNYVGGMNYDSQAQCLGKQKNVVHMKNFEGSKNKSVVEDGQFSGYAETDLDDDQPTNYSMMYAEQDEDPQIQDSDQPVNYSQRYEEGEGEDSGDELHSSVVEQRRTTAEHNSSSVHDDVVKTFFTEDTPFLSQATSMSDLSGKTKGTDQKAELCSDSPEKSEDETHNFSVKYTESEHMSANGSQSTDCNTSCTVIQRKQMDMSNVQNNNVTLKQTLSDNETSHSSQTASMYSYNDSSSSPSEKPKQYCTEDTPSNLSRGSSLSSLHSSDANETASRSSHGTKQDMILESIDENGSLNLSKNDETLKHVRDDSFNSANTTMSPAPKSVTFDDNNQVQQTPLMFSRCSSLGSLSSFDAHSVHSSVVSEYSRRASEVVSPSDLPDSPGDTMPPSPSLRKSPIKFSADISGVMIKKPDQNKASKCKSPKPVDTLNPKQRLQETTISPPKQFSDQPVAFAMEGTPNEHFSCNTSLSALTIDDEPFEEECVPTKMIEEDICADLCHENVSGDQNITVIETGQDSNPAGSVANEDDDDNSSVSEGEENLLAECISLAMPVRSTKKLKRSTSDGFLKKKKFSNNLQNTGQKGNSRNFGCMPNSPSLGSMLPSYQESQKPVSLSKGHKEDFGYGFDSPKKFETEGTPLNFSRHGSESDLSDILHDSPGKDPSSDLGEASLQASGPGQGDKSDVSSIDSDDNEDLLSEAISAAMPKMSGKKQQQWKPKLEMDRMAEGSDSQEKFRYPAPNFQKKSSGNQQTGYKGVNVSDIQMQQPVGSDYVMTYAVEGTPINFSRRTSLSDLTDLDGIADGASEKSGLIHKPKAVVPLEPKSQPEGSSHPSSVGTSSYSSGTASALDSPCIYGIEGTPASFSCNDSLSDLSCDEDVEMTKDQMTEVSGREEVKNHCDQNQQNQPDKVSTGYDRKAKRKPGVQSPAIARLKTPGKTGHIHPGPSCTSTPVSKSKSPQCSKDSPKTYAVEGTPFCMSRNSSLSSLNSDDHEALANQSGGSGSGSSANATAIAVYPDPQDCTLKVEDTPVCFSDNSSLSSLSVESLSFEPSESENALLEECINAAMPKSKKKFKTKLMPRGESNLLKTSPTAGGDFRKKTVRQDPFKTAENTSKAESTTEIVQPKNALWPQAERNMTEEVLQDNATQSSDKDDKSFMHQTLYQEPDVRLKEQKDACNHEKLQAAASNITDICMVNDNKLAEELQEIEDKIAAFKLKGSATFDKELCLEAVAESVTARNEEGLEKTDLKSEKNSNESDKTDISHNLHSSSEPTSDNCESVADIMKESFPEMSSSLASTITTSDQSLTMSGSLSTFEQNTAKIQQAIAKSRAVAPSDEELEDLRKIATDSDDQENKRDDKRDQSLDKAKEAVEHNMSAEDERALEENANIILSELSFTRDLSESDIFIDNETISLVSNDCASDTASEVSVCFSSSSKTASEKGSEVSTSTTISQHSDQVMKKGPRIVKPVGREVTKPLADEPTAVKGRRRLLTSPRAINSAKPKPESPSPRGIRGGSKIKQGNQSNTKSSPTTKKVLPQKTGFGASTPEKSKLKSISPSGKSVTSKPSPNRPSVNAPGRGQAASPSKTNGSPSGLQRYKGVAGNKQSPTNKPASLKTGLVKPSQRVQGVNRTSAQPAAKATGKDSVQKSPKSENVVDRPKPPVKQGTFTKDSPTENAPELIPEVTDELIVIDCEKPSSSGSSKPDTTFISGIPSASGVRLREKRSSSTSLRSSGESQAKTPTGKLLADSSFDSDCSFKTPTKDSPTTPTGGRLQKSTSKSSIKSLPKTSSRNSLNKSNSGNSLHKTPSNSSLNKGPKTPPRTTSLLTSSEGQSGLQKTTHISRSTTPRLSPQNSKPVPSARGSNATSRSMTPTGRAPTPTRRATTPTGRATTPTGRATTPTGRATTPTGRATTPTGRATTPTGRASITSSRTNTPTSKVSTPPGNASVSGIRASSNQASASPGRVSTPTGRTSTPTGRASTPSDRASTPTGRALTSTALASSSSATTTSSKANEISKQKPVGKSQNKSSDGSLELVPPGDKGKTPRQTVSKIASLWRKDPKRKESSGQPKSGDNISGSTKSQKGTSKIQSKSSKKTLGDGTSKQKEEPSAQPEAMSGLKRSSTYDKLTPDTDIVANVANKVVDDPVTSEGDKPTSNEQQHSHSVEQPTWRRTYTVPDGKVVMTEANDDNGPKFYVEKTYLSPAQPKQPDVVAPPTTKRMSGISIWRKTDKSKDKSKVPETTCKSEPKQNQSKRKGFSLWRKDDGKKSKENGSNKDSIPVGVATVVSPLHSPTKAAVVQPYNYVPYNNQKSATLPAGRNLSQAIQKSATLPANGHFQESPDTTAPQDIPSPNKHITKTEMLMARRRRSYMTSLRSDESLSISQESNAGDGQKSSCLVTTV